MSNSAIDESRSIEQLNLASFHQIKVREKIKMNKKRIQQIRAKINELQIFVTEYHSDSSLKMYIDTNTLNISLFDVQIQASLLKYRLNTEKSLENHLVIKPKIFSHYNYCQYDLDSECDLGEFINAKNHNFTTLVINITPDTEIIWKKSIYIKRNKKVVINGNGSTIKINETVLNFGFNMSMLIMELSAQLILSNLNILVKLPNNKEMEESSCIFNVACNHAIGMGLSTIKFENVSITSNINIINVGIHGFVNIICNNVKCIGHKNMIKFVNCEADLYGSQSQVFLTCSKTSINKKVILKSYTSE
ncbi:hypothetical protein TRFO_17796 [Tritrichomonas foetus]|uniref:Uncharacterized protein n=1 Tax=Tritrichomonas foetus TaxID=1144522 RepID=A0A1J4KND5_9EUKA|nr:hypothetical protein TRFO_17796 [Tritrichomonas foetus]|eukprot:OHT12416.1 hypothetical protein TRFO_17796 [Tritrichomonas foetus]